MPRRLRLSKWTKSVCFLLALSVYCSVISDDAVVRENLVTGAVFPIGSESISLEREHVVYQDGKVTATFAFLNTTDGRVSVLIGFPITGDIALTQGGRLGTEYYDEKEWPEERRRSEIEKYFNFHCTVNGVKAERRLVKSDSSREANYSCDYYYTLPVTFNPKELKTIVDTYNSPLHEVGSSNAFSYSTLKYVLKSGAGWKGPIGEACIDVHISKEYGAGLYKGYWSSKFYNNELLPALWFKKVEASPDDFRILEEDSSMVIRWDFETFEPDFNIQCKWIHGHSFDLGIDRLLNSLQDFRCDTTSSRQQQFFRSLNMTTSQLLDYADLLYSFIDDWAMKELHELTDSEKSRYAVELVQICRFYVNLANALHGYEFNTKRMKSFFSNLDFYRERDIVRIMTREQKDKLERILAIEEFLGCVGCVPD